MGSINQTLSDLKENFGDLDKRYKDSNSDLNADIEWVKNHVDILRNDLKGKAKELTDKILVIRDSVTSVNSEMDLKLRSFDNEYKNSLSNALKIQVEKTNHHTSEQISSEVAKIETLISRKLNETKENISLNMNTKTSEINQKYIELFTDKKCSGIISL